MYAEKGMKEEEEVTKVTRQMEECLCRNVHDVCCNNLSREEENVCWKITIKAWKTQHREDSHCENQKHMDELKKMERRLFHHEKKLKFAKLLEEVKQDNTRMRDLIRVRRVRNKLQLSLS